MSASARQLTDPFQVLCAWVADQPDGATLSYVEIEQQTGLSMSVKSGHRQVLRRALNKVRKRGNWYILRKDEAIRLSSPDNALDIARDNGLKVIRVTGDVMRRNTHLITKHGDAMQENEKREVLAITGFVGAYRLALAEKVGPKRIDPSNGSKPPAPMLPKTTK